MRTWIYTWMSSDGLRHEGEMSAADKDAVYAALRKQGIRAIKVTERIVPIQRVGFGGLRKRDWFLVALVCIAISIVGVFVGQDGSSTATKGRSSDSQIEAIAIHVAQPRPRKWFDIPRDMNVQDVFDRLHEKYLACYAMPGVPVSPRPELTKAIVQDFYDSVSAGILIKEADSDETVELKRVVAGMKEDARKYLGIPDGIEKLAEWLSERQSMECSYKSQMEMRVKSGEMKKEDLNEIFTAMGLKNME